jgi:hypothetical protein
MAGLFLRNYERFAIPEADQSMAPAYPGGSRVFCEVLDIDDALDRDTDVVYAMEYEGVRRARFGRVRGLPGDELGTDAEGRITVNCQPIGPIALRGRRLGRVPDGKVCIFAVNPQELTYPDSRQLGFIDRVDVKARILAAWGMGG